MKCGYAAGRARGLTLLEMLVALALFAILGIMAYSTLDQVLRVRNGVAAERRFWSRLAMCYAQLQDDLTQARPRTVIDDDGLTLPAFIIRPADVRTLDAPQLEFTRGGVLVVGNAVRGDLERVGYALRHHVLWRLSWPVLDRAPSTVPVKSAILRHVTSFDVQAFTADQLWSGLWPQPSGNSQSPGGVQPPGGIANSTIPGPGMVSPLPRGVEVKIAVRGRGRFKWLFLVHD